MTTQVIDLATRRKGRPATVFGKVPPPKVPNLDKRPREHLIPKEIERLIKTAKQLGRHGDRDATLILMGFDWDDKASWLRNLELFATELMPALNKAVVEG